MRMNAVLAQGEFQHQQELGHVLSEVWQCLVKHRAQAARESCPLHSGFLCFPAWWELAGESSEQGTQKMIHIVFGLFALLENLLCASQKIGPKLGPK